MGPLIKPLGLVKTHTELKQAQVAATILKVLGENPQQLNPAMAPAIEEILK
jgi:hypothetical protein